MTVADKLQRMNLEELTDYLYRRDVESLNNGFQSKEEILKHLQLKLM